MALYYPVKYRQPREALSNPPGTRKSSTAQEFQLDDDTVTSSYIFPNPPSSIPSPISRNSVLSTPTEYSFPVSSPHGNPLPNWSPSVHSPSLNSTPNIVESLISTPSHPHSVWEWPQNFPSQILESDPRPHLARRGRLTPRMAEKRPLDPNGGNFETTWREIIRSRTSSRERTPTNLSSSNDIPTPVNTIPLLSFFASLLATERTLVESISASISPPLFDGLVAKQPEGVQQLELHKGECEPHGFHGMDKFLFSVSEDTFLLRSPLEAERDVPYHDDTGVDGRDGGRWQSVASSICV